VSRIIAFFDFDGTITEKDTFLEFIKFSKGVPAFYAGFALYAPVLIAYKLNIISNQRAKEIMIRHFFGNMPAGEFQRVCQDFSTQILPKLIRDKALKELITLQKAGAEVVVVSASPENWLLSWCAGMNLQCIATRLIVNREKITGRIDGLNCHGEEKVRRIRERYNLADFDAVYCYGDTPGDRPMLALANYHFYKPFRSSI